MKNDTKKKQLESISTWYKTDNFNGVLAHYNYLEIEKFLTGKSALEIGPADGFYTEKYVSFFDKITCIEPSHQYCEDLTKKFGNKVEVIEDLVENVTFSSIYDTVLLTHVLEHIEKPIEALSHVKNAMHKDSRLIICVPNARSIHRLVGVEMGMLPRIKELNETDKGLGHYRVYDRDDLNTDIKQAGLKVVHYGGIYLKPLSNGQMQELNPKLIESFYNVGRYMPEYCADIIMVCEKN